MRRISVLVAGILLLSGTALGAQALPELTRGDRVRVWVPANALEAQVATVDSVTRTGLALRIPTTPFPLLVALDSIARLDVRGGGGGLSVTGGAAIGGMIGIGAGFAVMSIGDLPIPVGAIPIGVLLGALLGGALAADPWTQVWPRN